jgi:hypothetical protein
MITAFWGIWLVVVLVAIVGVSGSLSRIAAAIERQNEHYGIGEQPDYSGYTPKEGKGDA